MNLALLLASIFRSKKGTYGNLSPVRASAVLCSVALALLSEPSAHGQDIQPRRWSHLPIGGDFLGGAYSYTSGAISLEPALRIENAKFDLQTMGAQYIRSFELFGKSARLDFLQPYQIGEWSGLLDGVPARVTRSGWADTSLRFALNLVGAPPLSGGDYAAFRASQEFETIVGMGLVVQLPTGQYLKDKFINLGGNRFVWRPQIGVVQKWGNWSLELTGAAGLFSDNNSFFNGKRLEQNPVYSSDANLIYNFRPSFWVAASGGQWRLQRRRRDRC